MSACYFVTRDSNGPTIDRYFKITHNCDIINGHNTSGGIDGIKLREMGMIFFYEKDLREVWKVYVLFLNYFFRKN